MEKTNLTLPNAVETQNIEAITAAIEEGADVNEEQRNGTTLLHMAIQLGNPKIVEKLLEAGSRVDVKEPKDGNSALHTAVLSAFNTAIVELLLNANADVNSRNKLGNTVLHCAVERADLDMVKFLVESGADVNGRNSLGRTALHLAAAGHYNNMVKFLLGRNADWDILDYENNSVMDLADQFGNFEGGSIIRVRSMRGDNLCFEF